jgi:hypothetical protein
MMNGSCCSYYLAKQGDETGSNGGATSVSVEEDDPLESPDNGPLLWGPAAPRLSLAALLSRLGSVGFAVSARESG